MTANFVKFEPGSTNRPMQTLAAGKVGIESWLWDPGRIDAPGWLH